MIFRKFIRFGRVRLPLVARGEGSTEAHPSRVPMTNLGIVIILWGLIIWNARPMASHFEPAGPNKRWKSYR